MNERKNRQRPIELMTRQGFMTDNIRKARLLGSKANVSRNDSEISDKNMKIPINLTEESYNSLHKS